jgi:hypothetical protein
VRTLAGALAVGLAVSALTWRAGPGLGWLATDAVLVAAIGVRARARLTSAAWILGAVSLWLAAAVGWYASDWALATALPGSLGALAGFALCATGRIGAARVDSAFRGGVDSLRAVPRALISTARLPAVALDTGARAHGRSMLYGALAGIPLAAIFAALLSSDAEFRDAVLGLLRASDTVLGFGVWTAATVAGLLVAHHAIERAARDRRDRDAPREAIAAPPWPYRVVGDDAAPAAATPWVRPLTFGVALLQVVAVFGIYVAASARSLFADHAVLRSANGVTYAGYVHAGFVQVSVATLLAVTCVIAGHALVQPRGAATAPDDARIAGGRGLMAVELALLALVGVTLASSAHRLALYEDAYGYTELRLGVWWLQIAVAGLLGITAARSMMRSRRGWTAALAWSGVLLVTLAGSFDADGWIADRNVRRAVHGGLLDADYLASLSEDAASALPAMSLLGAENDENREMIEQVWSMKAIGERASGWRSRRGLGVAVRHTLQAY